MSPTRATLIKMKNGRHRVATRAEVDVANSALRSEIALKARIRSLTEENRVLSKPFKINNELADRLAKEFGFKVWPILEKWLAASHPPRTALAFSHEAAIQHRPIRRHTVHIPEIIFCFDEEIRP